MDKSFVINEAVRWYVKERPNYVSFARTVKDIIEEVITNEHKDIKVQSFSYRAKEISTFEEKCKKDKYTDPKNQITDMAGARVITYKYSDIKKVKAIIETETNFELDLPNCVDKTEQLGANKLGYRAYHYVVLLGILRAQMPEYRRFQGMKCEIQITSHLQNAWGEITHDAYKFVGTLPKEIERKQMLLAGTLENADNQLDDYASRYDEYVRSVASKTKEGDYNHAINSATLEEFMKSKFDFILDPFFRDIDSIISELNSYGLKTIDDFNNIINENYFEQIKHSSWRSFDGIIRNILIINDAKKYFDKSWNSSLNTMNRKNFDLYKSFGIDIESFCKNKNITLRD